MYERATTRNFTLWKEAPIKRKRTCNKTRWLNQSSESVQRPTWILKHCFSMKTFRAIFYWNAGISVRDLAMAEKCLHQKSCVSTLSSKISIWLCIYQGVEWKQTAHPKRHDNNALLPARYVEAIKYYMIIEANLPEQSPCTETCAI